MASLKEINLLADEGISIEVNIETLEITEVVVDGFGHIVWLADGDDFVGVA